MLEKWFNRIEKKINTVNQEKLKRARIEVESISDKLGKKIDGNIKETIALFIAMDIPTDSSCGGHRNETHDKQRKGYALPYVRVYIAPPEGWEEYKDDERDSLNWQRVRDKWRESHVLHRNKLETLLANFYAQRNTHDDSQLELVSLGMYGAFILQSKYTEEKLRVIKTETEALDTVIKSQNEMGAFTTYLRDVFLDAK